MTISGPSGTSYSLEINPIVSTPYGLRVKEPASVSNGYPLIAATQNGGGTLFRVVSGTGLAETRSMKPVTDSTYDLGTNTGRYATTYADKTNAAHYQCITTLSSNYTVTTSYNEMMIGPITINNGVTLTVNTGARLVIL